MEHVYKAYGRTNMDLADSLGKSLLQNAVLHNHNLAYSTKKCTSVLIHENTDCIFMDELTHFL